MITIHDSKDIEGMRLAGRIAAATLDFIELYVREGVTTNWLNELVHKFIVSNGASPATLNYHGFPKSCCISVNDVAVHGIPSDYKLKDSDIINIDVTVIKEGYHGDTSRMYMVGCGGLPYSYLNTHTKSCMWAGIEAVKDGAAFDDIAIAIKREHVRLCIDRKYQKRPKLLREVNGHGIGKTFHAEPIIQHYMTGNERIMKSGMCFTIEPCFSAGSDRLRSHTDGWSKLTSDGSMTAQTEHTVLVTDTGYEVLTLGELEKSYR